MAKIRGFLALLVLLVTREVSSRPLDMYEIRVERMREKCRGEEQPEDDNSLEDGDYSVPDCEPTAEEEFSRFQKDAIVLMLDDAVMLGCGGKPCSEEKESRNPTQKSAEDSPSEPSTESGDKDDVSTTTAGAMTPKKSAKKGAAAETTTAADGEETDGTTASTSKTTTGDDASTEETSSSSSETSIESWE